MTDCGLTILLMALGAGAEVVGLVLIGLDIRSDRRRARQLLEREINVSLGAAALSSESAIGVTAVGGRPPSLEDRVEALERRVEALRDEIDKAGARVSSDLRGEIKRMQQQLEANIGRDVNRVRETFLDALQGDIKKRVAGVSVLLFGIFLSLTANILSLYVTC